MDARRFLLFNNGMIGNTLFNMPVAAWLKREVPGCFVGMVVDGTGREMVGADPNVDALHVFNKKQDSLAAQFRLVLALRREKYDVSLQLRTGVRNELIARLAGVRLRAGFRLKGSPQHLHIKLDEDQTVHRLRSRAILMEAVLNRPVELLPPRLYPDPAAERAVADLLAETGTNPGEYLVLHPTGDTGNGIDWSLPTYGEAIRELSRRLPVYIVCLSDERATVERAIPSGDRVRYCTEGIAVTSHLIRHARYFIGNDSGPAHLACAWGVDRLVVYEHLNENFTKWQPADTTGCTVIFQKDFNGEHVAGIVLAAIDE
ncbi:glycosyltransferase family 9 protein [Pseudodesulfovibrio sp.]|uniref:glycosyltransferase family 9 protein n=1 Tax=unclassified Pseudodesulfovibrio TaxID=2661612 RepID=UPI003AFFD276